jgi:hypothetical protein
MRMSILISSLCVFAFAASAEAQLEPASPAFGVWRMPLSMFSQTVGNTPRFNFTTVAINASNARAVLDSARSSHTRLIIGFEGKPQKGKRFSLDLWKKRVDSFCPGGSGAAAGCFDFDPYIRDGTIVVARLFETNGEAEEGTSAPSLAEIKEAAVYVKARWPRLQTAVDGSRVCSVTTAARWSPSELNAVVINVFTRKSRTPASADRDMDSSVRCAEGAGLKYIFDINPFGRARTEGLTREGLTAFEHATMRAIMAKNSLGTIVWRWWPTTGTTVTNGVKQFPNFWNPAINPGIDEAMKRIAACAAARSEKVCK